ncbi:MAG: serine hydrolase domain-containing protein [Pseudomonadales bacterium]
MLLPVLTALLLGTGLSATASTPRDFESYLDGLVAAQFNDYQLAGMTLVLIHNGTTRLIKGYGLADLERGEAVDPHRHLFRPGSVSKLFTWTAVMQLVEQGRLDLDTDVSQYVDQFEIPNAFDTPLTLKHILTHAPGLEDGAAGYLFADDPAELVPLADSLAAHIPTQVRAPGTDAAYSNWATALAGLIVANVAGKPFEQYVEDHILSPLGMGQATFDEPLPAHLRDDMATGYIVDQGLLKPLGFEYIKNFGPAGALSASSSAMAEFMHAHLNQGSYNGAQILRPETVEQMHSRLFSHDERVSAMAHGFYETWRNGQRFIGHGGDTIAFHSEMLLDPTRGFGLFLSFNAPDGAQARSAIINGIVDFFYPTTPPVWTFPPLDGSATRVAEVSGSYRINRRSYTQLEGIVALLGDFSIVPASANSIHLPVPDMGGTFVEVEPYVFQKPGSEARLVFTQDDSGEISRALIASVPVMVADRVGFFAAASNHFLVIGLALLASLFVVINSVRNRKLKLSGAARHGRWWTTLAATMNLVFVVVWGVVLAGIDMNQVIFDFPPAGTGFALLFPLLSLLFTVMCVVYLVPVWRAEQCGTWARVRYSYVTLVFVLFMAVLNYWNLIGWHY